ncbi:MAG: dephospho-CoA kinase [Massilia sp.]
MQQGGQTRVLAITGGIASGKSRFVKAFAALGVPCLDTDLVARTIHQDPTHPATLALAQAFPQAMADDGRLARGSLRAIFAHDRSANEELKRILRPHVLAEAERWALAQVAPYVVWEAALLRDQRIPADRVLEISAPPAVRLARLAQRNPDWSATQAASIMALQSAQRGEPADDMVVNDGPESAIEAIVAQLHQRYLTLWSLA